MGSDTQKKVLPNESRNIHWSNITYNVWNRQMSDKIYYPYREFISKHAKQEELLDDVSTEHFKIIKSCEEEMGYEGIAHVRSLKRWYKIVIVQTLSQGRVKNAHIYFSTDEKISGEKVLEYYRLRYQIELLFRDGKKSSWIRGLATKKF